MMFGRRWISLLLGPLDTCGSFRLRLIESVIVCVHKVNYSDGLFARQKGCSAMDVINTTL